MLSDGKVYGRCRFGNLKVVDKVKEIKKTNDDRRKGTTGKEEEGRRKQVKTVSSFISLLGTPSDVHSALLQEEEEINGGTMEG